MNHYGQVFLNYLDAAEKRAVVEQHYQVCKIVTRESGIDIIPSRKDLETLHQAEFILSKYYDYYYLGQAPLRESYKKLLAKREESETNEEAAFRELLDVIRTDFRNIEPCDMWPRKWIDSKDMPMPESMRTALVSAKDSECRRYRYGMHLLKVNSYNLTILELENHYEALHDTIACYIPI